MHRTDCPDDEFTVTELLTLPAVLAGAPQVLAEPRLLDRTIRWAHVLENLVPRDHLRGGELVLTTGIGWNDEPDFFDYAAGLADAGVPALILELGKPVPRAPAGLVEACARHEVALVIMHREVAFVEITAALHERLFTAQTRRIEAGGEVTAHFTDLMQRGATANGVLETCAGLLGTAVVLEDQGYNMLRYSIPAGAPAGHFEHWHETSRREHAAGNPGRHAMPVQLHGKRYGTLVCPLTARHPAGAEHVLAMAASAIAVDLLQYPDSLSWEVGTGQQLLDELIVIRRLPPEQLAPRFEAAGFCVTERQLRGFALELDQAADSRTAAQQLARVLAPAQALIAEQLFAGRRVLAGLLSQAPGQADEEALESAVREGFGTVGCPLYVGPGGDGLASAGHSVAEALAGLELGLHTDAAAVFTEREPLALLAHELRHEPGLQKLPQQYLGPLLQLPERQRLEYLRVLQACLQHPTNRSQAAKASHFSRSVFYQKLSALERLLGIELDDPRMFTVLTLALIVHRQGQARPGRR